MFCLVSEAAASGSSETLVSGEGSFRMPIVMRNEFGAKLSAFILSAKFHALRCQNRIIKCSLVFCSFLKKTIPIKNKSMVSVTDGCCLISSHASSIS